jgi:hypothetical protein
MTHEDMLARLVAEAQTQGGDIMTLRGIVEEASNLGAARVLTRIGLNDEQAAGDLDELRELLRAWRDAKASAWRSVVDWAVRGVLALLLIGIAVRLGLGDMVR